MDFVSRNSDAGLDLPPSAIPDKKSSQETLRSLSFQSTQKASREDFSKPSISCKWMLPLRLDQRRRVQNTGKEIQINSLKYLCWGSDSIIASLQGGEAIHRAVFLGLHPRLECDWAFSPH